MTDKAELRGVVLAEGGHFGKYNEGEDKPKYLVPWNRVGPYFHQHPRLAVLTETIIYTSLCFTLVSVGKEVILGSKGYASCAVPRTENVQGAAEPERFIQVGKERFYSRVDGKSIDEVVGK